MEDWFPENCDITLENLLHSIHVQPATHLLPQITEGVAVKHVSAEKRNRGIFNSCGGFSTRILLKRTQ